jgi:hypothetical protein
MTVIAFVGLAAILIGAGCTAPDSNPLSETGSGAAGGSNGSAGSGSGGFGGGPGSSGGQGSGGDPDGTGGGGGAPEADGPDARRFELSNPMCTIELFDSGGGCPSDDEKCWCKPELDAVNIAKGSPGNPDGIVIVISQPQFGKRDDGTYAYDAYAAIKDRGNFIGHYVNELNPSAACAQAESWSNKGCAGGSGCGWRCMSGAARGDQIVDETIAVYGADRAPKWIALNEAWSLLYQDDAVGIDYRTWIRDLTKQMAARGTRPILYVQQRSSAAGPYTLLNETAKYAWIGVEAYLSGREVIDAPGECAPPYDANNWCVQQYTQIRNAIRSSATPAIPHERLVMIEHFATNTLYFVASNGTTMKSGWGRAYDDDPNSPTHGAPSTTSWNTVIERRALALKALPSLFGVGSYAWSSNGSGTGSVHRVQFAETWVGVQLP